MADHDTWKSMNVWVSREGAFYLDGSKRPNERTGFPGFGTIMSNEEWQSYFFWFVNGTPSVYKKWGRIIKILDAFPESNGPHGFYLVAWFYRNEFGVFKEPSESAIYKIPFSYALRVSKERLRHEISVELTKQKRRTRCQRSCSSPTMM